MAERRGGPGTAVVDGFRIIIPSESSKTGEKATNMHSPVRR